MKPAPASSRRFDDASLSRQLRLIARGAYAFVREPTSRSTFVALSEALVRFRSNHDAVDYMLSDPRVVALCRDRYVGRPCTPSELLEYPPGSLGHELAKAVLRHGYDPEFYREFYGEGPHIFESDEAYLRFRVRQMHDIVHVLTGFDMTEFPGELGMQAFNAAQTRRPFSIALLGFGMLRIVLQPDELARTLQQVAKGLAMGFAARSLLPYRFEDDWSKPVAEWRRELGITDEASFELGSGGSPAARPGAPPAERTAPPC
jgi:ubiquinone biosynthesis protein Coq4